MRKLVPVLFGCWFSSHATAATLNGATLPDTYTVNGQTLALNGIGLRSLTLFRIHAYVAGLYLPQPSHDAQQIMASPGPKVLLLKFLHSATKDRIEKQYRAGEAENCGSGGCDPADRGDFEHLVSVAPAVEVGDTTTYVFTGSTVQVLANDKLIDEFTNRDLAIRLLDGFIGAHPPSQSLRRQLLGFPNG